MGSLSLSSLTTSSTGSSKPVTLFNSVDPDPLPRVGSGLGGYDIALGFSHRHALQIACHILEDLTASQKDQIIDGLFPVFEQWKEAEGRPREGGLSGILFGGLVPKEELTEKERLEKIEGLKPWECDQFAKTPVKLFLKLFAEDYEPLSKFMIGLPSAKFEYLLALTILLSHNSDSEYQSGDCIEGAFTLAQMRLNVQKSVIKNIAPLANQARRLQDQAHLKRKALADEAERKILELHHKFLDQGNLPPYKEYVAVLGYSQSTISRTLKRNGFAKYKS